MEGYSGVSWKGSGGQRGFFLKIIAYLYDESNDPIDRGDCCAQKKKGTNTGKKIEQMIWEGTQWRV